MNNENTSASRQVLLQDIGLILFMASLIAGSLITVSSPRTLMVQNIILLLSGIKKEFSEGNYNV